MIHKARIFEGSRVNGEFEADLKSEAAFPESVVFPLRNNIPAHPSMGMKRSSANRSVAKISQPLDSPDLKVTKYFLFHKV